jgi:hypothetical protein
MITVVPGKGAEAILSTRQRSPASATERLATNV